MILILIIFFLLAVLKKTHIVLKFTLNADQNDGATLRSSTKAAPGSCVQTS